MKRIKAIGKLVFIILMEMLIFTLMNFLLGERSSREIFTKEILYGNILFLLLYNTLFLLFTYLRRNVNDRNQSKYIMVKTLFDDVFK